MPTFDTPGPVTADINLIAGAVQIHAGDHTETTVEVRPRDAAKESDVRAAEQVEVDHAGGRLHVRDSSTSALGRMFRKGTVDITVELPAGSRVRFTGDYANVRCEGLLSAAAITNSTGNIAVDRATGDVELTTGHGWIRVGEVGGSAEVKTTTGTITLGTVAGELRAKSAHGDIAVERALASATVRNSYGSVRLGQVVSGRVDLENSYGELEIGVREGTAAWLDVVSTKGVVRSSLEAAEEPAPAEETVQVRARTVHGDITVHRS
ncbi:MULTISPECIES: DUF4097 family beta strand repeat-containing protein [unclassified Nocardiopsis]|uniref:DUF4097 family beta strand repeat-containing protein n=1 Tax=unclassified Nocardiopsis TaxID=2649073 RepID=UPI00135C1594|nr:MULTISPECIES: DUF4097 family beta strand repeat-containing protein [unclassified Nocardiopsis]